MRRMRNRGPSAADLVRQTRVRRLLSKYGAYSRQVVSRSAATSELESSSNLTSSTMRSSNLASSSSSALQLATSSALAAASRRYGASGSNILHEDADLKVTLSKPSQLIATKGTAEMDKGLALAASQYVARVLGEGESTGVDSQRLKEDFLHLLERDWGFAGPENLSLGRVRITIKRRDNDLENIRRRAELEKAALEKSRLEERLQSRRVQAVSSSQEMSSSTTRVVKTRVVKTTKRTVQTVRSA